MKIRKTFWVFLFILLIAYLAGKQFEFQLINKLIYAILVQIIIAWFWARMSLNGIKFKRSARSYRKETGEIFEERFRVENASKYLKSWIELIDQSDLPGNNGSRIMAWIGRRELRNYSAYTLLTKRGKYNLCPTSVKSGDPFGFFEKSMAVDEPQSLLVLPVGYKICHFPLPVGYLPGGKSIRKKTTAITPHASGIREYLPGDSLNRIHWKKSAQRGHLISKEFEEDPQSDVWIILDSQRIAHTNVIEEEIKTIDGPLWSMKKNSAYSLPCDTYEYAVSIAATLSDYFIRIGQGVGFHNYGKQSLLIPPEKGYRQLQKILETLAFVNADGENSLIATITGYIQQITPGSLVIIISTQLSDGLDLTAAYLKLRKISPYYLLLENSTFTDKIESNPDIRVEFQKMGVANKSICFGDSISSILEQ
ncbi:MAG: DUF58 domain-containing protein [Anaerolineaceae bacterium]|nr:DUF58 domain-containing protein [Anaerolineaceae bacterium]